MIINKYIVRADGLYGVNDTGTEVKLEGCPRVTATGAVALRIPARDVTVETPLAVPFHDCSDFERGLLLVVFGGVPLSAIQAVRPGIAALIQNYMTNHGLTAGAVD